MSNLGYPLLIVGFMFSLITYTYQNLEYKGYASAHNCSGECYEEYLRVHGTMAEQLAKQQEAAAADPFSSIRRVYGQVVQRVTVMKDKAWVLFLNLLGKMQNTFHKDCTRIKTEKQ